MSLVEIRRAKKEDMKNVYELVKVLKSKFNKIGDFNGDVYRNWPPLKTWNA